MFDVSAVRKDFPILEQEVYGRPLVYLDNAATTQVPECVLARVEQHYRTGNGNVHRGTHYLANVATENLEAARKRTAAFIGAPDDSCIVFTRGTTEAINTVAGGLRRTIEEGDVLVATSLEHHSNYVPWQQLALERNARFEVVGLTDEGELDFEQLERLLELRPKVVALTCCSNVLGTVTPAQRIVEAAHDAGALVVLDGAQIMRHCIVDVQALGCDFFAFSGHKMMAGTGIGALYGTCEALERLIPCEYGGEMVSTVTKDLTTFSDLPLRFEAGTPNYTGSIALAAAMDYLEEAGRADIAAYEDELVAYAAESLSQLDHAHVLGAPARRAGCVSFVVDDVHHFDLCTLVDKMGVALRSGNNCARPVMDALGLSGVARLSPAFYNTREEIDTALACLERAIALLRAAAVR